LDQYYNEAGNLRTAELQPKSLRLLDTKAVASLFLAKRNFARECRLPAAGGMCLND
jgi:hypothetical protein